MALFARMLSGQLSVGQVVCARFVTGLVFLAVYYPALRRKPRFGHFGLWSLRGIFGGASVYLYFVCIDWLAVGPAVLLNACWPIYGSIFGFFFLGERVSGHLLGGLAAATLGAGLVIWGTSLETPAISFGVGAWAGMASAVFSGAAVVALRALRNDTDAATVFLSFCSFGLLFGLPFALADWRPITPHTAWLLLGVGVASTAAQMSLHLRHGLRDDGPGRRGLAADAGLLVGAGRALPRRAGGAAGSARCVGVRGRCALGNRPAGEAACSRT